MIAAGEQKVMGKIMNCLYCHREAKAKGLCATHYQRQRLGRPVAGSMRASPGTATQITVRCAEELKTRIQLDANRLEISPGEWWRRAAVEKLERSTKEGTE